MVRKLVTISCPILLLASPSLAAAPEEAVLRPFEECAKIGGSDERLQCYDAAVQRARSIAETNIASREVQRKEEFGLSAPRRETEEAPERANGLEDGLTEINAAITETYSDARRGSRLFILENGQIWQESSRGTLGRTPKAGSIAIIRKGGFGGYQLRVKDRNGFTYVKRLK